jgi:hypothetical protein
MKSSLIKSFILILIVHLFTGCKKDYVISEKQAILFQYEYVNYAWDYQHNGFFIDNEGNILTYSNPESWNFPVDDFTLDERQVSENIAMCKQSGIKIPKQELQKYINYIKNISSSKVTALKNVAEDSGSQQFICYQFSESTDMYKGYLIKMDGDFTCENLNFYSKKVASWMKNISNNLKVK